MVKRLVACNVSLTCPVRNLDKARQIFDADIYDSVRWVETSVESYLHNLSEEYDYIIHCASPTASKLFVEDPTKYFLENAHIKFSEGNFFSKKAGQFIRMNVACPRSVVNEALDRMLKLPEIR